MPRIAIVANRPVRQALCEALWQKVVAALPRNSEVPLSVGELSRRVNVSERTLRNAFAAVLGISPTRYLTLRRMHLLRAALSIADPLTDTVASIARTFGFSDCGRMAAQYRSLFGENPRVTLLRNISQKRPSPLSACADGKSSEKVTHRSNSDITQQNGQSPKRRSVRKFR